MAASVQYPDLGATVSPWSVPDGVADELPELYGSLLSTADWFATEDRIEATGAVVLDQPRHVLLFYRDGDTVEILNKEFAIGPKAAARACRALFRALPGARRIHLEILFPPWQLLLPVRILYWTDHMVISLPGSVDAYTASLGKRTRRDLRQKGRRLRQDHPEIAIETIAPVADGRELLDTFVSWKNRRFNERGRETIWQGRPQIAETFLELLHRRGEARVTRIDGREAAIDFVFPVGTSIYALQSAFDPAYEPYGLGLLSTYGIACEAVERGARRLSLLWGTTGYKAHLGAKPRRASRLSVFRAQTDRLYSLDEAWEVAWRNLKRNGQRDYWRARHAAGRRLRALAQQAPKDAGGRPEQQVRSAADE